MPEKCIPGYRAVPSPNPNTNFAIAPDEQTKLAAFVIL